MSNLRPVHRHDLPAFEPLFEAVEGFMGFVPNSYFLMAHRPEILRAFSTLAGAVVGPGQVDQGLKQLVAHVASSVAGCRYCQAHTASNATRLGVDAARLEAVWEFEKSALFGDGERAALRLARDAACVPNAVTAEHFAEARRHYSEAQVVEIMSVIALFGWLNRWNDSFATDLEAEAASFASRHLAARAWEPGKHAAREEGPGQA